MNSTKPRIKVPDQIKAGDVIEVKTLLNHAMETGQRKDRDGKPIERNIIHFFSASFDGKLVFKADFAPGISANPYLAFHMRVPARGDLHLVWIDDKGVTVTDTVTLNVVA